MREYFLPGGVIGKQDRFGLPVNSEMFVKKSFFFFLKRFLFTNEIICGKLRIAELVPKPYVLLPALAVSGAESPWPVPYGTASAAF
ncbi:MAG: hypothetical protein LBB78_08675 [Spirochaetaceae bacterium]|jgi:hypothetical protein|nr:hypothetical protein [Spirochaetaceae bacterium]